MLGLFGAMMHRPELALRESELGVSPRPRCQRRRPARRLYPMLSQFLRTVAITTADDRDRDAVDPQAE